MKVKDILAQSIVLPLLAFLLSLGLYFSPSPLISQFGIPVIFIFLAAYCAFHKRFFYSLIELSPLLFLGWRNFSLPTFSLSVALALSTRGLAFWAAQKSHRRNMLFASDLKSVLPSQAQVFVDSDIEGASPSENLEEGHLIRINPETVLPVDGIVTFGSSFVDEKELQGSAEPRAVSMGSIVFAGSKNKHGSFIFKALASHKNSQWQRIIHSLEQDPFPLRFLFPLWFFQWFLFFVLAFAAQNPDLAIKTLLAFSASIVGYGIWNLWEAFLSRTAAMGYAWTDYREALTVARTKVVASTPESMLYHHKPKLKGIIPLGNHKEDAALSMAGPLVRKIEDSYAFCLLQEAQRRNIRLEILHDFVVDKGTYHGVLGEDKFSWLPFGQVNHSSFGIPDSLIVREEGVVDFLLCLNGQAVAIFRFERSLRWEELQALESVQVQPVVFSKLQKTYWPKLSVQVKNFLETRSNVEVDETLTKLRAEGIYPLWMENKDFSPGINIPHISSVKNLNLSAKCFCFEKSFASIVELISVCSRLSFLAKAISLMAFFALILSIFLTLPLPTYALFPLLPFLYSWLASKNTGRV